MEDLVFLHDKQALTTSLKVAEYFKKQHFHVIRDIEALIQQMASLQQTPKLDDGVFTPFSYKPEENGRSYPAYYMNRDGFTLLAMGFTGGKALEFKLAYIQAFNAMEQKLRELDTERKNQEWQARRLSLKNNYKKLNSIVHELYLWAVEHGCTVPEKHFHTNFARLMNKTLGINPYSRDELEEWQLFELDKLQDIAKKVISAEVAKGSDYHFPYKACKKAFDTYIALFAPTQLIKEQLT